MKNKISLKAQILIGLIIFVLFILGFIFIFQNMFLDDFYKNNKIKVLERTGSLIKENIDSNNLDNYLKEVTANEDVCVRIVSSYYFDKGASQGFACPLYGLNNNQVNEIASSVDLNGGAKLFDNYKLKGQARDDLYIYGILNDTKDALILVSSVVTPLGSTVETINNQYIVIVFVVILATVLLALLISRIMIKPIKTINEEAKALSRGEYNDLKIKPNNKETEDLNSTLKKANIEIKKADTAKKELLANVSHDLRTPLTMIVGYGEMIKDYPGDDTEENADIIVEEAKRLSALVDDLIDVSRFETNKFVLNKEKVSLNNLLESVYKQYVKYFETQNVKFDLVLLDDIEVYVDERRIKQVLYNFINNALNYNDKENKEIVLGAEKINNRYRIFVKDNGQGISEENLDKVWDRYYKVDKEHRRSHLGTGIGLALAKNILEAHGLKYGVESKRYEYSKFYFDII